MTLDVEGLALARGGRELLRSVAFALGPGEAIILRGPNGVGKSSLLAAVAGELRPAAGRIAIDGEDGPARERAHFVGHRDALRAALTPRETLRFHAAVLGSRGGVEPGEALEALNLAGTADLPCGHLSAGQRRRLALARLLVAPRPLWLLDEPATALDAASRATLAGMATRHRASGGLILAASHDDLGLPEARDLDLGAFVPALPALGDAAFLA